MGLMGSVAIPLDVMTAGMFPTEIRNTALGCLTNVVICMTGGFSPLFLNWCAMRGRRVRGSGKAGPMAVWGRQARAAEGGGGIHTGCLVAPSAAALYQPDDSS